MTRVLLPPKPDTSIPSQWGGMRLRKMLQFLLWSQVRLSDHIGVNRRAISYWLRDQKGPRPRFRRHLDQLALESGFLDAERSRRKLLPISFGEKVRPTLSQKKRKATTPYLGFLVVGEDNSE